MQNSPGGREVWDVKMLLEVRETERVRLDVWEMTTSHQTVKVSTSGWYGTLVIQQVNKHSK